MLADTVPSPIIEDASLRFYLMGVMRIERANVPVRLPRRKVESLLAYLLLHPGQQPRDLRPSRAQILPPDFRERVDIAPWS